jgi:hypothetical protein
MGLRRLLLAKRWIVAASLALTGLLTALAANAFPGKTIKTSASGAAAQPSAGEASSSEGGSTEGSSGSLRAPEQAPQAGEESETERESSSGEQGASEPAPEAPVVSGGS